jgi:hypothetical protein
MKRTVKKSELLQNCTDINRLEKSKAILDRWYLESVAWRVQKFKSANKLAISMLMASENRLKTKYFQRNEQGELILGSDNFWVLKDGLAREDYDKERNEYLNQETEIIE